MGGWLTQSSPFRYSGGKADKPQMKSVPGGKKKGHSHAVVGSASTASPGKKPVKGTGEGAQGQERALQDGETASSPSLSAAKKLALEKDNQGKEEVEGDKASAGRSRCKRGHGEDVKLCMFLTLGRRCPG